MLRAGRCRPLQRQMISNLPCTMILFNHSIARCLILFTHTFSSFFSRYLLHTFEAFKAYGTIIDHNHDRHYDKRSRGITALAFPPRILAASFSSFLFFHSPMLLSLTFDTLLALSHCYDTMFVCFILSRPGRKLVVQSVRFCSPPLQSSLHLRTRKNIGGVYAHGE